MADKMSARESERGKVRIKSSCAPKNENAPSDKGGGVRELLSSLPLAVFVDGGEKRGESVNEES